MRVAVTGEKMKDVYAVAIPRRYIIRKKKKTFHQKVKGDERDEMGFMLLCTELIRTRILRVESSYCCLLCERKITCATRGDRFSRFREKRDTPRDCLSRNCRDTR